MRRKERVPPYPRVMLKVSGQALQGQQGQGLHPEVVRRLALDLLRTQKKGIQLAVTVGGGNVFRGSEAPEHGMDRATGDYMGMLATLMNAIALQSALENEGAHAHVHSAIRMEAIAEPYVRARALSQLDEGQLVIFAGGTGNPFFSTDMAAVLRALEMNCSIVLKGTTVGGVYTKDPRKHRGVKKYSTLRLLDAVNNPDITVMDNSALVLCSDHRLPVIIFDITKEGALDAVLRGKPVGTLIR